ncbi:MAG: hypothetical protein PVH88_22920 [Ignavibacteria bacterium]
MVECKKQFLYFRINSELNIILTVKTYKEGTVIKSITKLESLSNIRITLNPHEQGGMVSHLSLFYYGDNRILSVNDII